MAAQTETKLDAAAMNRPLPIVSCDAHAGPRLKEDLRPYCPRKYLEKFDEYEAEMAAMKAGIDLGEMFAQGREPEEHARYKAALKSIVTTAGHYDSAQRLKDMDQDGIASELNFPGTHNFETEPFILNDMLIDPAKGDKELLEVGSHIYASWLVDWCKTAPDRLLGVVTPPLWEIEKSIKEVEWAAKSGLKGVFLLSPRPGIKRYDSPDWNPFWAACEETGLHLHTHAGAPFSEIESPTSMIAMIEIELGGWPARQGLHQMIFAGVFERYPKLNIVFTEQNFDWWAASAREYDSTYVNHRGQLKSEVKRKPSEYMASNVHIGASFMAPFEAEDAVRNGYTGNVMWGRDYGHIEGTFVVTEDKNPETNPTRLSMRYAYAKTTPPADIRRMVSDNAIDFYKLDRSKLAAIAEKIKAPTLKELTTPIQSIPTNRGILAFREIGAWA
jgi:predicted TIM-barrel fold metal-dependent hydrolase